MNNPIDPDMEDAAEEITDNADPDWIKEPEGVEKTGEFDFELFMSSDGKHTVHVTVKDQKARKEAIATAMNAYDYVLARYGTKQAQAVKEYGNGRSGMQRFDDDKAKQDACKHINVKFVQSKTEKNPGRWFKSCKDCGSFLGWQS